MKFFAPLLVFLAKGGLLTAGLLGPLYGQAWLLPVSLAILGLMFVKLGCIDNAPDSHH
jgi:hypothetical protein